MSYGDCISTTENVCKAFGEEEILTDVSLQVRDGECFGLIGPNGAGKSTLFRIITEKFLLYGGAVQLAGSVTARKISQRGFGQRVLLFSNE